jgi:hypothetical protein
MTWESDTDAALQRIESAQLEVHARLMALEHSHARLVDLFEKLWEGFQLFKDSPMLRMLAGGIGKRGKDDSSGTQRITSG